MELLELILKELVMLLRVYVKRVIKRVFENSDSFCLNCDFFFIVNEVGFM